MSAYSLLCECGGVTTVNEPCEQLDIFCPKCCRSMEHRVRAKWPTDKDGNHLPYEIKKEIKNGYVW